MSGLYLLSGCLDGVSCFGSDASLGGEGYLLLSAVGYASYFVFGCEGAKHVTDPMNITDTNFFVATVISIIVAVSVETEYWVYPCTGITGNWLNILVAGQGEAIAWVLVALASTVLPASRIAAICVLESVVGAFFGYIFLDETLTWLQACGGLIMFCASLLTVLDVDHWFNDCYCCGTSVTKQHEYISIPADDEEYSEQTADRAQ